MTNEIIAKTLAKQWGISEDQVDSLVAGDNSRLRHLVTIYNDLQIYWGPHLANRWPTLQNTGFGGISPVDYMIHNGEAGILRVLKLSRAWVAGN